MDRKKIIIKTSILGIAVNIVLVAFKAVIGFFANSIAIIMDAVNNFTDALSSIITIIGTKLANKEPDKQHPYGHGRIEYFTAVILAAIIFIAGAMAIKESVEKIFHPGETDYSIVSLVIIAVAVVTKVVLGRHVKKTGEKVNSQTLVATGDDAIMDAVLSSGTLVAALINYFWNIGLEGYIGAIIGLFIIKTAIEVLKEAVDSILGVRADGEVTKKLKDTINEFEEVQGVYDLNLHNYGPSSIIASAHIQVRSNMTAEEIHILTREIEYKIYNEFGIALTLGIYAANDEGEYGEVKKTLEEIIKDYNEVLQIHGFYVDKANNVYFDLIVDFEAKDRGKVRDEIVSKLKDKYPNYQYNVIIDSDVTD